MHLVIHLQLFTVKMPHGLILAYYPSKYHTEKLKKKCNSNKSPDNYNNLILLRNHYKKTNH